MARTPAWDRRHPCAPRKPWARRVMRRTSSGVTVSSAGGTSGPMSHSVTGGYDIPAGARTEGSADTGPVRLKWSLVPVVEDTHGGTPDAAHDHDRGANPDHHPVRVGDHPDPANDKADDDQRGANPGRGAAMMSVGLIQAKGCFDRLCQRCRVRTLTHAGLLSSLTLLLFSTGATLSTSRPPIAGPAGPVGFARDSVWCRISPTIACWGCVRGRLRLPGPRRGQPIREERDEKCHRSSIVSFAPAKAGCCAS